MNILINPFKQLCTLISKLIFYYSSNLFRTLLSIFLNCSRAVETVEMAIRPRLIFFIVVVVIRIMLNFTLHNLIIFHYFLPPGVCWSLEVLLGFSYWPSFSQFDWGFSLDLSSGVVGDSLDRMLLQSVYVIV